MTLKLYYDLLSQPSRALIIFLRANKIPYEDCKVNLAKGEHLTEEFAKINPIHKVPAIVDGDFSLSESVGILRYLCREKDVPDHWYPKDSKLQARVDEYLEWQHLNTRANCAMYFQLKWLKPLLTGKPSDENLVAHFKKEMLNTLDKIENVWLGNKPYLTGDKISIADLLGACEMEQTRIVGYDPRDEHPKIAAWFSRVQKEMNPHYDEAHSRLNRIVEKYKGVTPSKL